MEKNLPIFLNVQSNTEILKQVSSAIPEDVSVYLFGGAVRNALHYKFFNEEMIQRDFDCIVIGNGEKFAENLVALSFEYGKKNSPTAKVLKLARTKNPTHPYNDYLFLDCKIFTKENSINQILEKISDFTIGAVALNIKDIFSSEWEDCVVSIAGAVEDIKHKRIKAIVNYPANIYKIIRLIYAGYIKPEHQEIEIALEKLKEISERKFLMETEKTVKYVGGEDQFIYLVQGLGIEKNILDFNQISS